jgi:hypothetical protein
MNDVKSLLIRILRTEFENKLAFVGTVLSVDGNTIVVEALEGKGQYSNIRLQANPGNGVLIIPTVGSYVIVGRMTENSGYVAMTSSADSIQLLDGSYGGLIKIDDLVNSLNALEKYARDTATWLDLHNHPSNGAPPSTIPSPSGPPDTAKAVLENPDITHGAV